MNLKQAAEMALEALMEKGEHHQKVYRAAEALRQALAQPDPAQWIGLTDEEIKEIVGFWGDTPIKGYTRKLFDQIEAKLKSKNT